MPQVGIVYKVSKIFASTSLTELHHNILNHHPTLSYPHRYCLTQYWIKIKRMIQLGGKKNWTLHTNATYVIP